MDHDMLLAIAGSIIAGGAIGLEREYRGRPAGFRTHIMVCLAACLLMLAAARQGQWIFTPFPEGNVVADPTRMAHGVLTGIGFLCAGVIFREGFSIHGLTTAASVWTTSAIGLLFGAGLYGLAIFGTVSVIVVLVLLRIIEGYLAAHTMIDVTVWAEPDTAPDRADLEAIMGSCGLKVARLDYALTTKGMVRRRLALRARQTFDIEALAGALRRETRLTAFEISPRDA